jgi:hypothetical protein
VSTTELGPAAIASIEQEISRLETRAMVNKDRADRVGAIIIGLSALSGIVLAIPDSTLQGSSIPHIVLARQILPVLTAAAYATLRYYKWGEKHRWYWYRRHKLIGLLFRIREGDSALAREYAETVGSEEDGYPKSSEAPREPSSEKRDGGAP